MSRTPEQRAAKIASGWLAPEHEAVRHGAAQDIARAIRAAENAAYERAAVVAGDWTEAVHGRLHRTPIEGRIRSLKTKAPRERKEKR